MVDWGNFIIRLLIRADSRHYILEHTVLPRQLVDKGFFKDIQVGNAAFAS